MKSSAPDAVRSMRRRLALVMGLCALLLLAAAFWVAARQVTSDRQSAVEVHIIGVANGFTRELQSRLQMADAMVQYLSLGDAGAGAAQLRQRLLNSECFRGLLLTAFGAPRSDDASPDAQSGVPGLGAADRLKLSGGESLLKAFTPEEGRLAVYVVHTVNVAGVMQVGYFELNPNWLWAGTMQLPRGISFSLVDARGRLIYTGSPLRPELVRLFAGSALDERNPSQPILRDWQQDGAAWRGALQRVDPALARLSGLPWIMAVYGPVVQVRSVLPLMLSAFWPLLGLLGLLVGAATLYLGRCWQPVLQRLGASFSALAQGGFERVALAHASDAPRALAERYNQSIACLEQHLDARAGLAQIDHLLLEAADLEGSFEPILRRVCALTTAHAASLVLIDRDAPGYARSFLASTEGVSSPVSRINLDEQIVQSLQQAAQGLTVQPHHLERYSFFDPLRELGMELCHAWPIIIGNEVAAVLAVGYRALVVLPAAAQAYGADCATRLRLALSQQTRDEQLYRQAHFDSLTALPNRLLFRDRLSQELANAAETAQRGALLYIDLDHFKKVNDSVGHSAGDQLLTIVAQRLRACVKDGDTVARLGGDEFTVILRNQQAVESVNEIAQRIIESVQRPVNLAGRDHQVRASIGITLYPDDANTIEELLRNADLAMYQAKDAGRSRITFFDRKMTRAQLPVAQSGLFRALRRREFALHYQPQYLLSSGELVGLEALLRWPSPREGMRFPNDFVPAAEQSGLIIDIGAWVLESACQQLALWRQEGIAPARLALNVSVQQLRAGDFFKLVSQTLERFALPPQMLELEVTESVFAEEEARSTLRQLSLLGVRLALDDFGTGYASLNYLRQHPVHTIKIDRSFMHEVPDNAQAASLAASIIEMSHALGKQVVAEGVETLAQLDFMREHGCDVAQGFVLSRPLALSDVSELLSQRSVSELLLQRAAG